MRFRSRVLAVAAVVVAISGFAGCAGGRPGGNSATPTPSTSDTPTAAGVEVRAAEDDPREAAREVVDAMTVREQAASVVMGHIPTTDAAALRAYMESTGIGGFLLMGANIPGDEATLRGLTDALTLDPALPPLIAVDQEGGDVARLPWDREASAVTLKNDAAAAAEQAFAARAALVRRAGIAVNFGVVADTTSDAGSFIYRRALGTSPEGSAERVAAAVRGEGDTVLSTLKHFPGHGAAPGDSHATIPTAAMSYDAWLAADAVPFAAGIDAGAPLLMYGHLAFTAIDSAPASLSAEWHRIAREELGFDGVAVTDDLGMLQSSGIPQYADPVANAVAALVAGNDLVLTVVGSNAETAPRTVDGIVAAVDSGTLSEDRLRDAAERVMTLRLSLGATGAALEPCADCVPVE